jgi:predicted regulator of Ras-like GTPase activity (Roadblock/LC7/MglB family)
MSIIKKQEEVRNFFKEISKDNKLDGILLADMEGLPLISFIDEGMDEDTLSSSMAAMVSAGLITTSDADKGELNQVILDTEKGYIVLIPMGGEYILGIFTPKDAKLGIIRVISKEVESFLEKISQ